MNKKICKFCNLEKDVEDFHKSSRSVDGYRSKCRVCTNIKRSDTNRKKQNEGYIPTYVKINLSIPDNIVGSERFQAYHREYRKIYKEEIKAKKKIELERAKIEGINHYGGKCNCCGESKIEFLTLEHLHGRDKGRRRRTGKGAWLEIKREGFPDKYTVLCFNCNCAKGIYGRCPHTWENNE
jgi:hypothetical protein